MYTNIINPKTGRSVSIFGKVGQKVLRNYINQMGGHTGICSMHITKTGRNVCHQVKHNDHKSKNCVFIKNSFKTKSGDISGRCRQSNFYKRNKLGKKYKFRKKNTISLLQLNVLARKFTKYNKDFHNGNKLETEQQTIGRYSLATERILHSDADVVCLQECDSDFFEMNMHIKNLMAKYDIIQHNEDGPGVCILVNKNSMGKPIDIIRVGGNDLTGGSSKKALAVLVTDKKTNKQVWVCSVHLAWSNDKIKTKAIHLLNLLDKALLPKAKKDQSIILSGDFNLTNPLVDLSDTFLRNLSLVEFDKNTGLSGKYDFETKIDHIFSNLESKNVSVSTEDLKKVERNFEGDIVSGGPYILGSDEIQSPSDHICIKVVFNL